MGSSVRQSKSKSKHSDRKRRRRERESDSDVESDSERSSEDFESTNGHRAKHKKRRIETEVHRLPPHTESSRSKGKELDLSQHHRLLEKCMALGSTLEMRSGADWEKVTVKAYEHEAKRITVRRGNHKQIVVDIDPDNLRVPRRAKAAFTA